jgi:hypothetical protein
MALIEINGHTVWRPALSAQSIVLDLGANQGRFSHALIRQFGCRIEAVEAKSEVVPAHSAASPVDGDQQGNRGPGRAFGLLPFGERRRKLASGRPRPARNNRSRSPAAGRLIVERQISKIDLIKFDIEGAEIEVLNSASDAFLKSIPQITVEFHDFLGLTPVETVVATVRRLESLGFFTLKMWRNAWGDTLFVNRQLLQPSAIQLAWANRVTRNWWGAKRIVLRSLGLRK